MYCAYVTTLKELRKHNNADRLQCATVFSNNVIVDLSYNSGDRVVYFPVDGQLGQEFAEENNLVRKKDENGNNVGGYLDPDKRNIRALKLRGEQSDGLVLPLSVLGKYVDIETLKDGDQITILNGCEICRKYIPRSSNRQRNHGGSNVKKNSKETKEKISYPLFLQHTDTQQLAYNQDKFHEGDICYITLKMHGSSGRTANTVEVTKKRPKKLMRLLGAKEKISKKYSLISGTRRTTLTNYDGGYYGSNAFREKYHKLLEDKLPKGVEIYYEIVGWIDKDKPIMGRCNNKLIKDKEFSKKYGNETIFTYGCDNGENDCYVYRMTISNPDGYTVEIPWEQVQVEADKLGFKCVPTFERFIFTTWDDLMARVEKYYDGVDPIGQTHIREGVVVRIDNKPSFTAYKHKNWSFKVLESIIKDTSDEPDIEEAEEVLSNEEV